MYVKIYRNSFMKHVNEGIQNIYNIGALTVNIEFMWQGLETGKDELLVNIVFILQ